MVGLSSAGEARGPHARSRHGLRVAAHRRPGRHGQRRGHWRLLCARRAGGVHQRRQQSDGGVELGHCHLSGGDGGLGDDQLFRRLDGGRRRATSAVRAR